MALKFCYPPIVPPKSKGQVELKTKQIICEYIPALIFDWKEKPFFTRVADAFRTVFSPGSPSWVPASGLDEQTIQDLRILATVDALAEKLSPALRDSLASSVLAATKRLELPAESELTAAAA